MIITDIRQGVKNPNRVNVFVDSKYSFSLDVAQVVDYGVKIGLELSAEKLNELKKASEFGKLYQRTLEWVLMRPRSEREVRDYLYRKLRQSSSDALPRARLYGARSLNFAPAGALRSSEDMSKLPKEDISELSREVLSRLVSRGYVDDRKFAEFWAENRFVKKGVSRKRLKMELQKKGIKREIIDEVLDGRDDEAELRKMIARKRAKYTDDEKLMAYLVRQGFSYDLARKLVQEENY